jgi:hypothetical protein
VPLIEGVVTPVVGDTSRARAHFPDIRPLPYRKAVTDALRMTSRGEVETRWSGALNRDSSRTVEDREGIVREVRSVLVDASPSAVFRVLTGLGGDRGWLAWDAAWRLRGLVDRLVGGPGLRRGRRHPDELLVGEAVDFWRVERMERDRLLRLRAEMKVPGSAWLQWEIFRERGRTRVVQSAIFAPTGVAGMAYWYVLYPVHALIFSSMIRALKGEAEGGAEPYVRAAGRPQGTR